MDPFPKLVIRVPTGLIELTKVTLNGQDVRATRVSFDTGEKTNTPGFVKVRLEFVADVDIEMDGGHVELAPVHDSIGRKP